MSELALPALLGLAIVAYAVLAALDRGASRLRRRQRPPSETTHRSAGDRWTDGLTS